MAHLPRLRSPWLLGIAAGLMLTGCGGPSEFRANWPDGNLRSEGLVERGLQTGDWRYYRTDGSLEAAGAWERDEQVGVWRWYTAGGDLKRTGSYDNGLRAGHWRYFHPDGSERAAGPYRADRQEGLWRYRHPGGNLAAEGLFVGGSREGLWRWWDASGNLTEQGVYFDGVRVDRWAGTGGEIDRGLPGGIQRMMGPTAGGSVLALSNGADDRLVVVRDGADQPLLVLRERGALAELAAWVDGMPVAAGSLDADANPVGVWLQWSDTASTPREVDLMALTSSNDVAPDDGALPEEGTTASASEQFAAFRAQVDEALMHRLAVDETPDIDGNAQLLTAEPDPGGIELSPVADVPGELTQRDQMKAQMAVDVYTNDGSFDSADGYYDIAEDVGNAGIPRPDLIGQPLPRQRFLGTTGRAIDISAWQGERNVLVIILRGFAGTICPYCSAQVRAITSRLESFAEQDTEVIFVYPGSASSVPLFMQAVRNLGEGDLPPVSVALDVDLALVRSLDIESELASPTSILIDKQGQVQFAYVGRDLTDRPSVIDLLEVLEGLSD